MNNEERVFTRLKEIESTYFPNDHKDFSRVGKEFSGEQIAKVSIENHLRNLDLLSSKQ